MINRWLKVLFRLKINNKRTNKIILIQLPYFKERVIDEMKNYKENWLPHLKNALPQTALGNKMTMYAIALEGWRRGLIVRFRHTYNSREKRIKIVYSLSYKGRTHEFAVSRGDKVSKEAINICINKDTTKEYLLEAGVSTPKGKGFTEDIIDDQIIQYASSIGFPLVLKPIDGLSGRGVIVNIQNIDEFKKALNYVRHKLNYKNVIVESYVKGEDCRVYVIEDQVIAAVSRIPANIVGDGTKSIAQLIKQKNKERNNNPNHYRRPIKIDNELIDYIKTKGYTLDSVPKKGELVFLKKTSNISAGGEPIDITDELTPEIKKIAVDAVKAVPGLVHCSVDMLVDMENNTGSVIEINSKPQIGLHLFPEKGKARDIPKAIIDYYFPETKSVKPNTAYYFDFNSFLYTLNSGAAKEVRVKKIPQINPVMKNYIVSGDLQQRSYKNWIRRRAHALRLDGFTKTLDNGNVSIVVAGEEESLAEFKSLLENTKLRSSKVDNIEEKQWNQPVKMGFYIIEEDKDFDNQISQLEDELVNAKIQIEQLQKEMEQLRKENSDIKNSKTYKYSSQIRKLVKNIKSSR